MCVWGGRGLGDIGGDGKGVMFCSSVEFVASCKFDDGDELGLGLGFGFVWVGGEVDCLGRTTIPRHIRWVCEVEVGS